MTAVVKERGAIREDLPQAQPGDGWVCAWKTPAVYGEAPDEWTPAPLLQRGSLTAFVAVSEGLNPRGLGAIRLYKNEVVITQNGDELANLLSNSIAMGSACNIGRAWMKSLVDGLPKKKAVEEAKGTEALHADLEALYSCAFLYEGRYANDPHWAHRLIIANRSTHPELYGHAWVPKAQVGNLMVEGRDHPLSATHDWVNVLESKHTLFAMLGLHAAVEADNRRIANAAEHERLRGSR